MLLLRSMLGVEGADEWSPAGGLRLRGGGGDGGVYPLTHAEMQWMKPSDALRKTTSNQSTDKMTEETKRVDRATLCAASSKPLAPPVVVTDLGLLCNKEDLIEALLSRKLPAELDHVKSMRDFTEATLHANPAARGDFQAGGSDVEFPFVCPFSGAPLNGRIPFVLVRASGHVVAERALKQVGGKSCPVTEAPCAPDELVWVNPTDEQREELVARAAARKAAAKGKRRKDKAERAGAASAGGAAGGGDDAPPAGAGKAASKAAASAAAAARQPKRPREWDQAVKERAASSEVYKSLFVSKEDREKMEAQQSNDFCARGIPAALSRSKFTL